MKQDPSSFSITHIYIKLKPQTYSDLKEQNDKNIYFKYEKHLDK